VTSDNRIVKLFNNYNKDRDDLIKLDEFMQFYIDHSKTKPDTVWQNLKANNVGDNLKPMPENKFNLDVTEYDLYQKNNKIDQKVLPRYTMG
jgi:hypothetical protein